MDKNNKNFDNTLNLQKKVLSMYASLELRTQYFTNKLLTSDTYIKALEQNSNSKIKTYISEMPIQLDNKITNNDLLGSILKDIIIRYYLMKGEITETKLLFSYINSATNDSEEYQSMTDLIKKEVNTINKSGSIIDFLKLYRTTINSEFAQKMIDTFYELYKNDKIYSEDMPTRCCTKCKNAIVDKNEIDILNYHILFRVEEDLEYILAEYNNLRNTYIVASCIKPWTLLGISNIALQSEEEYSVVETTSIYGFTLHYIIATKYVESYMASVNISNFVVKKKLTGKMFEKMVCSSPLDYTKKISCITTNIDLSTEINSSAITITPAHSYLEYSIYKENNCDLDKIRNYVDMNGKISTFGGEYKFKNLKDIETEIVDNIKKSEMLLFEDIDRVNIPKCANCGSELVYRYLSEWYINDNGYNETNENNIKEAVKKASMPINIPDKKSKYLKISKNTNRGVTIPVISCGMCNKKMINDSVIRNYKEKIQKYGAEKLYEMTPEDLLEGSVACECGGFFFFKNENLFNDSFEVLTSDIISNDPNYEKTYNLFVSNIDRFTKSIEISRYYNKFSDRLKEIDNFFIYGNIVNNKEIIEESKTAILEDNQSSEIDKEKSNKRKKNKLNGKIKENSEQEISNRLDIDEIINKYGPDILRLGALYKSKNRNILIDENTVKYEERIYTNIRKTLSFIISNILDFDPDKDYVEIQDRTDLDKYIYVKIKELRLKLISCYNEFNFYEAYDLIKNFCMGTLCEEYFNAIKYNLYILNKNDNKRRATQSTLQDIFNMLKVYLGPIIPYLFIEGCSYIEKSKSLILEREKKDKNTNSFDQEYEKWVNIFKLKKKIIKEVLKAQNEKIIGDTLQACVYLKCKQGLIDFINQNMEDILKTLNISEINLEPFDKLEITVKKSEAQKCERCHNYKNDVGRHTNYRYLCYDCATIIENR